MGRFSTLEINEVPEVSAPEISAGSGERIKDAQYFLDLAEKSFFRLEYETALREYSRAGGVDIGSAEAWQGQVFSLLNLEEFHEAGIWLEKSVEVVGETADLLALRALIASRTGEFDRACAFSDASLGVAGNSPLPFIVRGELFCYARRNAEQCFNQACSMPYPEWKTRALIADSCLCAETKASAMLGMTYLMPALERNPTRPELYLRLAKLHIRSNNRRAALNALEQARALDPELELLSSLTDQAGNCSFWKKLFHR